MASKYRVGLSTGANNELEQIQEYITSEFKSPQTAKEQVGRILKAISTLMNFPKLYRVRRKNSKGQELRYLPVDNFIVICTIDESKNLVKVLHILYGRRNFENII